MITLSDIVIYALIQVKYVVYEYYFYFCNESVQTMQIGHHPMTFLKLKWSTLKKFKKPIPFHYKWTEKLKKCYTCILHIGKHWIMGCREKNDVAIQSNWAFDISSICINHVNTRTKCG